MSAGSPRKPEFGLTQKRFNRNWDILTKISPTNSPSEGGMKEQYVGDVNDYRKYALLRHFAIVGALRVGVCWMLTPPDTGNLRHYLSEPKKWRDYDEGLFDQLSRILVSEIP